MEGLIAKYTILVSKDIIVDDKFKQIFLNKTIIKRGSYNYKFPFSQIDKERLMQDLRKKYPREITLKVTAYEGEY